MKTQTKSIFVLLAVLILGMLLGVVIDRSIVENQMRQKFFRYARPGMERMILERIIQPSSEQKAQIDSILQKYGDRFRSLRFKTFKETRALMDSMRQEIDPILTEEQKEKIRQNMERMMRFGQRRGPMPFGRERWRDFPVPPPDDTPEPPPPMGPK